MKFKIKIPYKITAEKIPCELTSNYFTPWWDNSIEMDIDVDNYGEVKPLLNDIFKDLYIASTGAALNERSNPLTSEAPKTLTELETFVTKFLAFLPEATVECDTSTWEVVIRTGKYLANGDASDTLHDERKDLSK